MFRRLPFLLLFFCLGASGQAPPAPTPFEPHDPRDFFTAAAPAYNFNDPTMGPWHLRATYQTYSQDSKPLSKGTYEHWWASPTVYRNTWNRPGLSHTDWHTADGKHAFRDEGSLDYFESALESALLSPLPDQSQLDPSKFRLEREDISMNGAKFPCIKVIPLMPLHGRIQQIPLGLFPTYCFGEKTPVLRIEFSWKSLTTAFNKIEKVQGRYLPREVTMFEGKRKILTATVDIIDGISSTDPALIPPPDLPTSTIDRVNVSSAVSTGLLIQKQVPVYPADAREAGITGKVVLQAVIGRDGAVHELRVSETPWPTLAASAMWAVSQWRYKPYMLNGQPVEVQTVINVIFSMK